jgi:hypothetical protein
MICLFAFKHNDRPYQLAIGTPKSNSVIKGQQSFHLHTNRFELKIIKVPYRSYTNNHGWWHKMVCMANFQWNQHHMIMKMGSSLANLHKMLWVSKKNWLFLVDWPQLLTHVWNLYAPLIYIVPYLLCSSINGKMKTFNIKFDSHN